MSKNLLSSDVTIKGSLSFSDELILDGTVEGEVTSDNGHLTIGENATIKGEVKTKAVIVFGKVDGNVTTADACELKANAQIVGDIKAGTLSIEPGAAFMGQSSVGNAVASAKPSSSSSAKSS
ncbi:MAG: polymer-forming cytoskeletal protein [Verrucomicrobiota bacterium]